MMPGASDIVDTVVYFEYIFHALRGQPFIGDAVYGPVFCTEPQRRVGRDLFDCFNDIRVAEIRLLFLTRGAGCFRLYPEVVDRIRRKATYPVVCGIFQFLRRYREPVGGPGPVVGGPVFQVVYVFPVEVPSQIYICISFMMVIENRYGRLLGLDRQIGQSRHYNWVGRA